MWGEYIKWRNSIPESNKSLPRSEFYVKDNTQLYNDQKIFHLSLDDTINIFKNITDNENIYLSVFENPMLGWLKSLHQETGVKVSRYVFFSDGTFSLSQCTTKFKNEFEDNCDWLRFGFHSGFPERKYNCRKRDFMPRTKGSKNCSKIELNAQSAKLQKDKVLLEEGIAKTVAQTEK